MHPTGEQSLSRRRETRSLTCGVHKILEPTHRSPHFMAGLTKSPFRFIRHRRERGKTSRRSRRQQQ